MKYNLRSSQTVVQSGPQLCPLLPNLSSQLLPGAPIREARPARVRKPTRKARETKAWDEELRKNRGFRTKQKKRQPRQGKSHTGQSKVNMLNNAVPPNSVQARPNKFIDPNDGDIIFPELEALCYMSKDELDEFNQAFSLMGDFGQGSQCTHVDWTWSAISHPSPSIRCDTRPPILPSLTMFSCSPNDGLMRWAEGLGD